MLDKANPNLLEVISNPICTRAIQVDNYKLIDYLSKNSNSLVKIALDTSNDLSFSAFSIIYSYHKSIIYSILDEDTLTSYFNPVFNGDLSNDLSINRFVAITRNAFLYEPITAFQKCKYLIDFLDFCYIPSISELFLSIISEENNLNQFRFFFEQQNFMNHIIQKLSNLHFNDTSSNDYAIGVFLYKFIEQMAKIEKLRDLVTSQDVLKAVFIEIPFDKPYLINSQWLAISEIISQNNVSFFVEKISFIFHLLREVQLKKIFLSYHSSALRSLINAMKYQNIDSILIENNFPELLISLLHSFPHNSFLQMQIISFIESVTDDETLSELFIPLIFDYFAKISFNDVVNRGFSWKVLKVIKCYKDQKYFQIYVNSDLENNYKKIDSLVNSNYGGKLPSSDDSQINVKFTDEQLMRHLSFLMFQP